LRHRLRDQAPPVAIADVPLAPDAPQIALAQDLSEALRLDDLGELGERNALAAGRADRQGLEARERIPVVGELHHDAEAALALEDLRDVPALGGRLARVSGVLAVAAVSGGGLAIDHDL